MMYLKNLMREKHMTRADLCRESMLPDSTVRDILNGKAQIDHCEAGTLFDIANALDTSVEDILNNYWCEQMVEELDFLSDEPERTLLTNESAIYLYEAFDAAMKDLKNHGDMEFVKFVTANRCADLYYKKGRYGAALFIIGVTDYLCHKNNLPPVPMHAEHRNESLATPVFPLRLMNVDMDGYEYDACKMAIMENAVPELACFNIFMTEDDLRMKV